MTFSFKTKNTTTLDNLHFKSRPTKDIWNNGSGNKFKNGLAVEQGTFVSNFE